MPSYHAHMKRNILPTSFFMRSTLVVAEELLGKFLVMRQNDGSEIAHMITNVEAYDGFQDKASHASRGRTNRNAPMFEAGGIWYVYFVYGMHHMLNVVTGQNGYPAAVLLRGVEGMDGPAKLTKQYGIDRNFYSLPARKKTGLWIEDRGFIVPAKQIKKAPRIGVDYAGPVWAKKRYRFFIARNV
ncbi:MAG: DNA-3-methyladenine glycosylase [Parcubacteria group bacterium Gr01-1014_70]|nr:MAG: DNA-3-methyladenine glycosylase [Parcubacteria group bacterium Gr01-1014_70]